MKSKYCPECKRKLLIFKEIYIHPDGKCSLSDEGVQIIVQDPIIQKKFKELVNEKKGLFDKILWKLKRMLQSKQYSSNAKSA